MLHSVDVKPAVLQVDAAHQSGRARQRLKVLGGADDRTDNIDSDCKANMAEALSVLGGVVCSELLVPIGVSSPLPFRRTPSGKSRGRFARWPTGPSDGRGAATTPAAIHAEWD